MILDDFILFNDLRWFLDKIEMIWDDLIIFYMILDDFILFNDFRWFLDKIEMIWDDLKCALVV